MKILPVISLLIGIVLFQSCGPGVIPAKFQRDSQEVIDDLKELGEGFEDAGIRWQSVSSTKSKSTSILLVILLNGKNLPEEENSLRELGKEALMVVTNSIENEGDYDVFRVLFTEKEGNIVVERNTVGFAYELSELQE